MPGKNITVYRLDQTFFVRSIVYPFVLDGIHSTPPFPLLPSPFIIELRRVSLAPSLSALAVAHLEKFQ